jgi:NADH-quinone oxidoreductase subunit M
MTTLPILSLIVLTPLAGAIVIAAFGRHPAVPRIVAVTTGAVCLIASIQVFTTYDRAAAGFQFVESVAWIPALGANYTLGVDGISVPMLLLMGIVVFTGSLVSWDIKKRPREFFALLLLLVAGVFGVFTSIDGFLLFFFYEMAVVPMYLLIAIWGSTRKDYSAMKLTLFLFAGSAALLIALVVTFVQVGAGTFDLRVWSEYGFSPVFQRWVFALAFVGFGALVPIWPLHTWSPDGHVAAPTAVSMMHAGVLLKLGAFGIIRMGVAVFPDGFAAWSAVIAVIGAINVLYGAFCAMNQTDLKYVIGYSSVSHMGYVLLGLATMNHYGIEGAVFQMFAHGIMTALFFALIGYIYESSHTRQLAEISGLGRRTPLIAVGFVIASAASMGMPSTSGFVAELLVYLGLIAYSPWLAALVFVAVVVTAAYLLRMLSVILLGEPSAAVAELRDPRPVRLAPIAILSLVIMGFGLMPSDMYEIIRTATDPLLARIVGG